MFDRKNRRLWNEQLDQRGRELIRISALSETEADQLTSSPYLFRRLRARIAACQAHRRSALRWYAWAFPAVALVLFIISLQLASLLRAPEPRPSLTTDSTQLQPPADILPSPTDEPQSEPPTASAIAAHRAGDTPSDDDDAEDDDAQVEITTEFLPVAYWGDPTALRNGQVLRVELPRSALRLFGLPVGESYPSDSIKADVVLSDDGLVLAIRFLI